MKGAQPGVRVFGSAQPRINTESVYSALIRRRKSRHDFRLISNEFFTARPDPINPSNHLIEALAGLPMPLGKYR
jgi:hypothetical protein